MIPEKAAQRSAEFLFSSAAFTFAPFSMSNWAIFSYPMKNYMLKKLTHWKTIGCKKFQSAFSKCGCILIIPAAEANISAVYPFCPMKLTSAFFWMSSSPILSCPEIGRK